MSDVNIEKKSDILIIDKHTFKKRIRNIILFNQLIDNSYYIGLFLKYKFIIIVLEFFMFIIIIVDHNVTVIAKLNIIILVTGMILGIIFIKFKFRSVTLASGIHKCAFMLEGLSDLIRCS